MHHSILPSNTTPLQRALEATSAGRYELLSNHIAELKKLHNPLECPTEFLPFLAWHRGVDFWDDHWSEPVKRAVIAGSLEFKRHKGSPWSVKEIIRILGYGEAEILQEALTYGAGLKYGQGARYGELSAWYHYSVRIEHAISERAANNLRHFIEQIAPLTRILISIHYDQSWVYGTGLTYGNGLNYGQRTHGQYS